MSNKKKRKSPWPTQIFKVRSCSEGYAGPCSLKEGFIQLSCFQMSPFALRCWKWNLTIAGCFIFFPRYDSNKTWAFLFQSAVAGLCCNSKWFLNAVEQDSLAFCHTQHIVGIYLHIPNSFTYNTWIYDPFSPMPIHASNTDASMKFCSLPTLPGINIHSQTQSCPPCLWLSLYLLVKHVEENKNFWKFHIGNAKIKPR